MIKTDILTDFFTGNKVVETEAIKIINDETAAPMWGEAELSYAESGEPWWKRWFIGVLEALSGRSELESLYWKVRALPVEDHELWREARKILHIELDVVGKSRLAEIPPGPLVLISNHPFGVVDGLTVCELAATINPDFRILINSVLTKDARVNRFYLPVDFGETPHSVQVNLETRRRAIQHLSAGGLVVVFPAGGVATAPPFSAKARELPWKSFAVKLAMQSKARILPVFVEGQNSRIFHLASAISQTLRLGLLLHEVKNKRGSTVRMHVGPLISADQLAAVSRQNRLDFLQNVVENIAGGSREKSLLSKV